MVRATATALCLVALLIRTSPAAPPEVTTIVKRMKASLEPERPSLRRMTFRISGEGGTVSQVVAGQARKTVRGTARILTVLLAPESLRGIALLVQEATGDSDVQWAWIPAIGRVRKIVSPEAYAAFLDSDFTYADLGFVSVGTRYRFAGEEDRAGVHAYKIEGVPKETWYYSRTVTWVAVDSSLPLERDLYDPAGQLWKVERWDQVSVVDRVPTTLHRSMEDVQAKTRTDIDVSGVRYDADVPDSLLEPTGLPKAAAAAVWSALGG